MNNQGIFLLATLLTGVSEEIKHPLEKKEHIHQEQHSILKPQVVNVYNISGRIQVVDVNGVVLATRHLDFDNK